MVPESAASATATNPSKPAAAGVTNDGYVGPRLPVYTSTTILVSHYIASPSPPIRFRSSLRNTVIEVMMARGWKESLDPVYGWHYRRSRCSIELIIGAKYALIQ